MFILLKMHVLRTFPGLLYPLPISRLAIHRIRDAPS
jgi:hypothetical protein